ncbi:MAG: hypothetical protein U5L01_12640 [Rheinheimera sp.]|nr:hypothetical protein [Rheinheimera sp.]
MAVSLALRIGVGAGQGLAFWRGSCRFLAASTLAAMAQAAHRLHHSNGRGCYD